MEPKKLKEDDEEVITSVNDLEEEDKPLEQEIQDSEDSVELEENSEIKIEEDELDEAPDISSDELVEIDGVKYKKDELEQIFLTGKRIAEYQKEHPGFEPILLHKDYTKKTQELADLKRQAAMNPKVVTNLDDAKEKTKADLSKFRKEDIEYFEQLASALGYAKAEEFEKKQLQIHQQTYESVKREEINKFLDSHPEYRPENDPNDLKWGAIISEFNLYKLPENPRDLSKLLERAHSAVSGFAPTIDSKKVGDILARKKAANAGQTSTGGGGGSTAKITGVKSKKMERLSSLAQSGAFSGYTKEEIEEMFS